MVPIATVVGETSNKVIVRRFRIKQPRGKWKCSGMFEKETWELDWKEEANAVIRDIQQHVHKISISKIPSSKQKIFFNLTTLEMKDFCVELSEEGFRFVGESYDTDDKRGKYPFFETPYSMLDHSSPAYRDSFREELVAKLFHLQKEQSNDTDSQDSHHLK